jgi:phosphoglycerate dehydrogenase-like enzyme
VTAPRRMVVDLGESRAVWAPPPWVLDEIRGALPADWALDVVDQPADGQGDGGPAGAAALAAVRGAEVYVGYGFSPALFAAATSGPDARLRWVHSAAAGVGGSLHPAMEASEVVLTNSAGVHAEPMADTVLAMVLHFARGVDFAVRAQAERRWWKVPFEAADTPVRELAECTMGVVGLGGIGRAVARRGAALGMRVVAARRRSGDGPDGVEVLAGPGALERVLERSDFLVLTLPLTEETRGLVGAAELARLPRGATVINVGRGAVIDEGALVEALRSGHLRGAGLDVFAREPLAADSPLWGLANVLVTPHVSATSHRFWRRQTDLLLENLRRYLAGRALLNTVDKRAGY